MRADQSIRANRLLTRAAPRRKKATSGMTHVSEWTRPITNRQDAFPGSRLVDQHLVDLLLRITARSKSVLGRIRPVALKFLAAHLPGDEEIKARFRREAVRSCWMSSAWQKAPMPPSPSLAKISYCTMV